jgi:cytidine deaminase
MKAKKSSPQKKGPSRAELYELARKARLKAYAPYSRYKVGAAIVLEDGSVFTGCNVENSTYGATTCAEQIAVFKAVSEKGKIRIQSVMVVTESNPPASPCGICRQVLAEFGPKARIYVANTQGKVLERKLSQLFPEAFTPDQLGISD